MGVSHVVSIEIGLIYTKVCEVNYRKKNTKVGKAFVFETPENTIEDGYIRDKTTYANELKRQLAEHKISNKNVLFTIASNKILSREVTIPAVKEKRIMDIVKAEANEYFPMDITEHVLTYTLLGPGAEPKQLRLLVFAAPLTLIKNYYNLAEMLGVTLVALDYVGNSSYQILKRIPGDEVNFVIQLNQQNSLISILKDSDLLMQRNVNFGMANLLDVMKGFRDFAEKNGNQCYDYLCENAVIRGHFDREMESGPGAPPPGIAGEEMPGEERTEEAAARREEMTDELMEELRLFVNNVSRVIEYYNTREPNRKIGKLYLLGKGARLQGLSELLQNETGYEVELLTGFRSIAFQKKKKKLEELEQHREELFSCVGAALNPVNFIPEELRLKTERRLGMRLYILLFILAAVSSGTLLWYGYSDYQEELSRRDELTKRRDECLYIEPIFDAWSRSVNAKEEAEKLVAMTSSCNEYLLDMIGQLEEKLPQNSIVQSFSATENGLFISFVTDSKETAAALLTSLKQIPYVGRTGVAGITESGGGEDEKKTVTFSVSIEWALPEEVTEDE